MPHSTRTTHSTQQLVHLYHSCPGRHTTDVLAQASTWVTMMARANRHDGRYNCAYGYTPHVNTSEIGLANMLLPRTLHAHPYVLSPVHSMEWGRFAMAVLSREIRELARQAIASALPRQLGREVGGHPTWAYQHIDGSWQRACCSALHIQSTLHHANGQVLLSRYRPCQLQKFSALVPGRSLRFFFGGGYGYSLNLLQFCADLEIF